MYKPVHEQRDKRLTKPQLERRRVNLTCPKAQTLTWTSQGWLAPKAWELINNPKYSPSVQFATVQYSAKYHTPGKIFAGIVKCYYELKNGTLLMLKLKQSVAKHLPPPGGGKWVMNIVHPPIHQTPGQLNGYCGLYDDTEAGQCVLSKALKILAQLSDLS